MAAVSKQEYLKRYLSNADDGKKRKRKKASKTASKRPTSIIVDDDISLKDTEKRDVIQENEIEGVFSEDENPAVYEEDGVTKISLETFKKREEDLKNKWAPISLGGQSLVGERDQGKNSKRDDVSRETVVNGRRQGTPDVSPRRGGLKNSADRSPPRKKQGINSAVRSVKDSSPYWAQISGKDVTQVVVSPTRSRRKRHDSGDSLPGQTRDSSPDQSPVRRRRLDSPDVSPLRRNNKSPSDLSPPQKKCNDDSDQSPPQRRAQSDSDQSPPRKRQQSDSDQSPPRKCNRSPDRKDVRVHKMTGKSRPEEDMPGRRRAGLLSAADLQKENEKQKKKEAELFSKMDPSVSGRHSETVYRDKMGRKKDVKLERIKRREEERKEMEENEKFMEWGRGVTQTKDAKEKLADDLHEMEKPLARYRDDKDLDSMLKAQEREDDPMLAYMKQKKVKQNSREGKKGKPVYKGPDPPPNRFNIRPGYRWDGVDRSNGFERKRFTMLANKMATQAQAYKWSTEDM